MTVAKPPEFLLERLDPIGDAAPLGLLLLLGCLEVRKLSLRLQKQRSQLLAFLSEYLALSAVLLLALTELSLCCQQRQLGSL